MSFINNFFIKISSQKVGTDEFGNQYFKNKKGKRFVIYNGISEPSKIPAKWHGWIHHSTDVAPVNFDSHKHSWEKIHLPNLTGTKIAYSPKNHTIKKSPYEAWKPNA